MNMTSILGGDDFDLKDSLLGDPLFRPFYKPAYENINLDFKLDTDHFTRWLEAERQDVNRDNYRETATGSCELSCLYICMLLNRTKLEGNLTVYYGKYGFWEHFWVGYTYKGQEYFIDMTLIQFISEAPYIAITKAHTDKCGYNWLSEPSTMNEYLEEVRAFRFYKDPTKVA